MSIKSMLAEAIISGAAEGTIPFETAKDEFIRRYEKGGRRLSVVLRRTWSVLLLPVVTGLMSRLEDPLEALAAAC